MSMVSRRFEPIAFESGIATNLWNWPETVVRSLGMLPLWEYDSPLLVEPTSVEGVSVGGMCVGVGRGTGIWKVKVNIRKYWRVSDVEAKAIAGN